MGGYFNSEYVDDVFIIHNELDWRVLMVDMLGRAKEVYRSKDTPVGEILREVSRYNPQHISVIESGS
jgi:hypothetical protein